MLGNVRKALIDWIASSTMYRLTWEFAHIYAQTRQLLSWHGMWSLLTRDMKTSNQILSHLTFASVAARDTHVKNKTLITAYWQVISCHSWISAHTLLLVVYRDCRRMRPATGRLVQHAHRPSRVDNVRLSAEIVIIVGRYVISLGRGSLLALHRSYLICLQRNPVD